MKRAIVLSSGGVDSSVCVGLAVKEFGADNVMTVSVFYNQKHNKEIECADKIAKHYGLRHEVIDLSAIFKDSNCSLLKQSTEDVPEGAYVDQIRKSDTGVVATYVPGRNALMLTAISSLGQSIYGPEAEIHIYLGAHADDAAGNAYPDCSKEFTDAISQAIYLGTDKKVYVETPLVELTKPEVVKIGLELNVPFELTWSCYNGGEKACGKCGTCVDRALAFKANHAVDPIEYEIDIDWEAE